MAASLTGGRLPAQLHYRSADGVGPWLVRRCRFRRTGTPCVGAISSSKQPGDARRAQVEAAARATTVNPAGEVGGSGPAGRADARGRRGGRLREHVGYRPRASGRRRAARCRGFRSLTALRVVCIDGKVFRDRSRWASQGRNRAGPARQPYSAQRAADCRPIGRCCSSSMARRGYAHRRFRGVGNVEYT